MRRLAIYPAFLVLLIGYAALLFFAHSEPSTAVLDSDLAAVRAQLKQASDEDAKYSGGLVKAMIEVRVEILKSTEAMLSQKRASLLRRIDLRYTIGGKPNERATKARLDEITANIAKASQELAKNEAEAARYSGGLILAMSEMAAATNRVTIAQLNLAYYSAKYGSSVPSLGSNGLSTTPQGPPGKVVTDKDAL